MKICYYQDKKLDESRIEVYFKEVDSEISTVMNYLESYTAILGKKDGVMKQIFLGEILYIEVVERRCYTVCIVSNKYSADFVDYEFLYCHSS